LAIRRQRLTLEEAKMALETIMQVGVQVIEPAGLYTQSLELASVYNTTNAYDTQYMALAEMENCELWTADERLVTRVKPSPSWLRLV
jgi:predicted nucleic acid-binding protein